MRARMNFMIDAAILGVYLIVTNPVATGTPVHEWLSIGLALGAFVHLVLHWEWTVHAAKRVLGRLGSMSRLNFTIDAALLVAVVAVVLSGLLVSRSALRAFGYVVADDSVWHVIHSGSSTALLALVGLHLGLHWSWMSSMLRNQVIKPLLSGARAAERTTATAKRSASAGGVRKPTGTGIRRVVTVLVLVAGVAAIVWVAAPRVHDQLGWLVLSGGAEIAQPDRAEAAITVETAGTAGFEGTVAERVAVRTTHSLALILLTVLGGVVAREFLKTG